MAEAVALIGLAAATAQFVEYGLKLVERLNDAATTAHDRPNAFTAIKVRLPAVIGIVRRIQKQMDRKAIDTTEAESLLPVIENTNGHVRALLALIEQATPSRHASKAVKYFKALRSLSSDSEVQKISDRLQGNLQIIALFQTTSLVDWTAQTTHTELARSEAGTGVSTTLSAVQITTAPSSVAVVSSTSPSKAAKTVTPVNHVAVGHPPTAPSTALANPASNRCAPTCSCVCHRPYQLSTPALLSRLLGQLSVNYAGSAFITVPCSERRCLRPGNSAARVMYRFPPWALDTAVHVALASSALNVKVNLNTLRVLPDSAEVFSVISRGDLTKLRHMFRDGHASIYDVSRSNWTLVHTAFTLGRFDMCQFLITEGADLTIDAANGSNAIERAWFLAHKLSKCPGDYVMNDNAVLRAVDLVDFISSQQYNLIHKIVLGITKLDLAGVLEGSTADIDGRDVRGRTPLWWAAAQGNVSAVQTLLDNGADHNIDASLAQTPLYVARNAAVIQILLAHGARVNVRDALGRTPLHCFCYRQIMSSASIVRAILDGGAAVDVKAHGGQTPLHYAAMFGNAWLIEPLVGRGADINAVKNDHMTALMAAVRYDKSEVIKTLLASGADGNIEMVGRQNILHVAAAYAGVEVMKILASSSIRPIDLATRDSGGLTPEQHFQRRKFRFEELEKAFQALVQAVGRSPASLAGPSPHDLDHSDDSRADEPQISERYKVPGSFSDT